MKLLDKAIQRLGRKMVESYASDGEAQELGPCSGCHDLTLVTLPECVAILAPIVERSLKDLPFISRAMIAATAPLTESEFTVESYEAQEHKCFFCTDPEPGEEPGNRCSIYPVRPIACRLRGFEDVGESGRNAMAQIRVAEKVAKQAGVPCTKVPLPVGVLLALRLLTDGAIRFSTVLESVEPVLQPKYWAEKLK